ncbi:MAG: alanine racemase [Magnetococcales bacterium]|nr:alanine racemase [Magnetococcales bacterium]
MPPPTTTPGMVAEMATPAVGRPTWLEIDLAAIVHNYRVAREAAGARTAVFPVVKANAYGLGAPPIARALAAAGADGLCVALVEEAAELRRAGLELPLVLLSGFFPGLEQTVIDLDLQPVVFELEAVRRLSRLRGPGASPVPVHVKVDTGMGRMGFSSAKIPAVLEELAGLPGIRVASVISHLACADEPTHEANGRQLSVLLDRPRGPTRYSLANSAGLLAHPATRLDWTRPGIMIYGASPFFPQRTWREDGLRSVVRWLTRIVSLRAVDTGTPLGYGHEFVTRRPSRIAVVPVGYADGFSRCLKNRAHVLIHGAPAPVVGRISMDLTLVDVTQIPDAVPGGLVTLLGGDGAEFIGIEEMAGWMETIPYEVLCRLGSRLPRLYPPPSGL